MSNQDPTPYGQQSSGPGASGYDPVTGAPYTGAPGYVPPAGGVPPGYDSVPPGYGAVPPGAGGPPPMYPPAPMPGAPNPALAAVLGFIPGVGAMYNGQFAKGIAHIVIFAVFESLAKHTADILGLLVAGWEFYMAFDAYHTARARRDGLPLPDPFGLNNIGDRFGFRGNPDFSGFWHHGPAAPGAPPVADPSRMDPNGPQTTYQVDPAGNVYNATTSVPPAGSPYGTGPAYGAGYGSAYPPPPAGYPPYGASGAGYPGGVPYGAPGYGMPPMPPVPPVPPGTSARAGLPTSALWLIGLGAFALLGSLHSFAFLEGEVTGGIFLIGLSAFMFYRRQVTNSALFPAGSAAARWNLIRASRGAGVLFIVGLLTVLQGLHVVNWEASWPFLLIFLGVMALAERFAMNGMNAAGYPGGYPAGYPPQPSATPEEPVVETSSPTSIVPRVTRPGNDLTDREGR